ncbi:uncharacterized protein K452DRAFT_62870 [Aplosporella prunicola CBS 121167]|uniref:Uncharacterized protein n=1 Tax=Aplosporella prunicola CBS 121167 TaxID=1176127 RepID=A0A6A6B6H8_9PEZI|nr:uncharacterized protein K452DRAFT_62870 [Aplosporella prunicola CBS 121167]KAF2139610.1 hypothetical protein K452DRAFT_62870 [Aplosporella prunicola CBS 121167]
MTTRALINAGCLAATSSPASRADDNDYACSGTYVVKTTGNIISLKQELTNSMGDGNVADHQFFLRPSDGRLVPLVVQSFEHPAHQPRAKGLEWIRIGRPQFKTSSLEALSYWILSPILIEGSQDRNSNARSRLLVLFRWTIAAPVLLLMIVLFCYYLYHYVRCEPFCSIRLYSL